MQILPWLKLKFDYRMKSEDPHLLQVLCWFFNSVFFLAVTLNLLKVLREHNQIYNNNNNNMAFMHHCAYIDKMCYVRYTKLKESSKS